MSCLTMRADVAAQGGEVRYVGIAHGVLAHHLPRSIPPRYHPLLLTCQYLYFCTSKASKMSTSAHSQHSRLIAKWRGCRVSVVTCPVLYASLSSPLHHSPLTTLASPSTLTLVTCASRLTVTACITHSHKLLSNSGLVDSSRVIQRPCTPKQTCAEACFACGMPLHSSHVSS